MIRAVISAALVMSRTVMSNRSGSLSISCNRRAPRSPLLARCRKWYDIEIGVTERGGIAQNVFDNIGDGDDTFGAPEFIDDYGHALRSRQKTAQQIQRPHCFGHE